MSPAWDEKWLGERVAARLRQVVTGIAPDVRRLLEGAMVRESNPTARGVLATMLENVDLAARGKSICQSPGYPTVYVRLSPAFPVVDLTDVLGRAIVQVTREGLLRPSMVHPLSRQNSGDNSGRGVPDVQYEIRPAGKAHSCCLEILFSFKGCGAELGNRFRIFTPAELSQPRLIQRFVAETVLEAGGKPCPPVAVGVGIGGQMHVACNLSRRVVSVRAWDDRHPDGEVAALEEELLALVNSLGIGPAGTGGDTTALAVKVGLAHTHTAICPVAVNFHCWVARRGGLRIHPDGTTEDIWDWSDR